MTLLVGMDGCRDGWICLARSGASRAIEAIVVRRLSELARWRPRPDVIAIDNPIGLPESGRRACDVEARRILGAPRGSSVFPAPIRPALRARTRLEASRITVRADGRRVGVQSWGLYAKVASVDGDVRSDRWLREVTREVHPEISFWAWNDRAPMKLSKKTAAGRRERLALVERHFGNGESALVRPEGGLPRVAKDDILDAFAALWTAERIYRRDSKSLPEDWPRDRFGLPMRIVF